MSGVFSVVAARVTNNLGHCADQVQVSVSARILTLMAEGWGFCYISSPSKDEEGGLYGEVAMYTPRGDSHFLEWSYALENFKWI